MARQQRDDRGRVLSACSPDDACKRPSEHSSDECYSKYFESAYEGRRAPQPMSFAEWQRAVSS